MCCRIFKWCVPSETNCKNVDTTQVPGDGWSSRGPLSYRESRRVGGRRHDSLHIPRPEGQVLEHQILGANGLQEDKETLPSAKKYQDETKEFQARTGSGTRVPAALQQTGQQEGLFHLFGRGLDSPGFRQESFVC